MGFKKSIFLLLFVFSANSLFADSWLRKADFPGTLQNRKVAFSVGDKGYVAFGVDSNVLWQYNGSTNTWAAKAPLPFTAGYGVAFSIGSYGYIFPDSSNVLLRYDTAADTWSAMAPMPGLIRFNPVAMVINNRAYVGGSVISSTGAENPQFYCYDPSTNNWSSIADLPDSFFQAITFVAHDKGYLVSPVKTVCDTCPFFISPYVYEYDPVIDTWSRKADFPGQPRADAGSFSVGRIGYFGLGDTMSGASFNDWWQYDPAGDTFYAKAPIPGLPRDENPTFSLSNKGYVLFGSDLVSSHELWEYIPDSVSIPVEVQLVQNSISTLSIFPNPATRVIDVAGDAIINHILIADAKGRAIYIGRPNSKLAHVDVSSFAAGTYYVKVNNEIVQQFSKL